MNAQELGVAYSSAFRGQFAIDYNNKTLLTIELRKEHIAEDITFRRKSWDKILVIMVGTVMLFALLVWLALWGFSPPILSLPFVPLGAGLFVYLTQRKRTTFKDDYEKAIAVDKDILWLEQHSKERRQPYPYRICPDEVRRGEEEVKILADPFLHFCAALNEVIAFHDELVMIWSDFYAMCDLGITLPCSRISECNLALERNKEIVRELCAGQRLLTERFRTCNSDRNAAYLGSQLPALLKEMRAFLRSELVATLFGKELAFDHRFYGTPPNLTLPDEPIVYIWSKLLRAG